MYGASLDRLQRSAPIVPTEEALFMAFKRYLAREVYRLLVAPSSP
jgi:hypothetical protein